MSMKKFLTLITVAALLVSALCVFPVSADGDYTVTVLEQIGLLGAAPSPPMPLCPPPVPTW